MKSVLRASSAIIFFLLAFSTLSESLFERKLIISSRTKPSWAKALDIGHLTPQVAFNHVINDFKKEYDFDAGTKHLDILLETFVLQVDSISKKEHGDIFEMLNKEVDEIMVRKRNLEKEKKLTEMNLNVEKFRDLNDIYPSFAEVEKVLDTIEKSTDRIFTFGLLAPSGIVDLHHELAKLELKIRSKLHPSDGVNRSFISKFFTDFMLTFEKSVTKNRALIEQKDEFPRQLLSEIAYLFYTLAWDEFSPGFSEEPIAKIKPFIIAFCASNKFTWKNQELNLLSESLQLLKEAKPLPGDDDYFFKFYETKKGWYNTIKSKFPNCEHVYENYIDEEGIKRREAKNREINRQRKEKEKLEKLEKERKEREKQEAEKLQKEQLEKRKEEEKKEEEEEKNVQIKI